MIYVVAPLAVTFVYASGSLRRGWSIEFFDDAFCALLVSAVTSFIIWTAS